MPGPIAQYTHKGMTYSAYDCRNAGNYLMNLADQTDDPEYCVFGPDQLEDSSLSYEGHDLKIVNIDMVRIQRLIDDYIQLNPGEEVEIRLELLTWCTCSAVAPLNLMRIFFQQYPQLITAYIIDDDQQDGIVTFEPWILQEILAHHGYKNPINLICYLEHQGSIDIPAYLSLEDGALVPRMQNYSGFSSHLECTFISEYMMTVDVRHQGDQLDGAYDNYFVLEYAAFLYSLLDAGGKNHVEEIRIMVESLIVANNLNNPAFATIPDRITNIKNYVAELRRPLASLLLAGSSARVESEAKFNTFARLDGDLAVRKRVFSWLGSDMYTYGFPMLHQAWEIYKGLEQRAELAPANQHNTPRIAPR